MVCNRCNVEKPKSEFYLWNKWRCRECCKEIKRNNYPGVREYHRNYWRKWYSKEENHDSHTRSSVALNREWRKRNHSRLKVYRALKRAVARGTISKPTVCSKCLTVLPLRKIEGHHQDYNKPLDIIWLCRNCHKSLSLKRSE